MALPVEAVFYRGDNQNRTDYVPSGSPVLNGQVIDIGTIAGCCTSPEGIAVGAMGSLATAGVFKIKKASGSGVTFAKTVIVYWDTVNRTAVAASGTNIIRLGIADEAAADTDDHVKTEINRLDTQAQ